MRNSEGDEDAIVRALDEARDGYYQVSDVGNGSRISCRLYTFEVVVMRNVRSTIGPLPNAVNVCIIGPSFEPRSWRRAVPLDMLSLEICAELPSCTVAQERNGSVKKGS